MAESPLEAVSAAAATTATAAAAEHDVQAAPSTTATAPAAAAPAATAAASEHFGAMPLRVTPKLTDEELAQWTRQIIRTTDMRVRCTVRWPRLNSGCLQQPLVCKFISDRQASFDALSGCCCKGCALCYRSQQRG